MKKDEFSFLKECYVRDLQKPQVDKFDRAAIIRNLMDEKDLSIRQFAEIYGIPRSTVEDWLLYNRITQEEYYKLIKEGKSPLEIYRALRENKKAEFIEAIDVFLTDIRGRIRTLKHQRVDATPHTPYLIDSVVNELNALHSSIIVQQKGKSRKGKSN